MNCYHGWIHCPNTSGCMIVLFLSIIIGNCTFYNPIKFQANNVMKNFKNTAWILGWEPPTTFERFSSEKSGIVLVFLAKITAKDDVTITQIPRVNHLCILLQTQNSYWLVLCNAKCANTFRCQCILIVAIDWCL